MKSCESEDTDKVLYTWFSQESAKGSPIIGNILMEKTHHFHTKFHTEDTMFTASGGWLLRLSWDTPTHYFG